MGKVGYKKAASIRNELSARKTVGVVETVARGGNCTPFHYIVFARQGISDSFIHLINIY